METKQKRAKVVMGVLALAALCVFSLFAVGGNLEPSAPPGPTMKTLDEVEPRIPVQSLPGDSNSLYVISQPGSYYFTGNIVGEPNKCGITITANNVTVDLMGFGLIGVPGSLGGICVQYRETDEPLPIEEVSFNVCIRNGTICTFGTNGLEVLVYIPHFSMANRSIFNRGGNGVEFVYSFFDVWPTCLQLEKLSVHNNGADGIRMHNVFGHMEDVSFCNNGGNGIHLGSESYTHMEDVSFAYNGGHGLYVDGNSCCHMEDVSFTYNGGDGMHILGMMTNVDAYSSYASHNGGNGMYVKVDGEASIHMEDMSFTRNDANGLVVDGNSCYHMMLDAYQVLAPHNGGSGIIVNGSGNLNQCTVVGNGGSGIEVGTGSTVRNCTARGNTGDGIVVSSNCHVVGNTCESNGVGVIGTTNPAGIRATDGANRIEANHVIGNNVGIDIGAGGNLIIKNSATGNTTNYDIASGNTAGPTLGTGDIVSDNPHANYEF